MPYLAAILSGTLAALSFPTIVGGVHFPNLFWLAWVALIPYLWILKAHRLTLSFFCTFLLGVFWNGLTSYWIFNALYFNGQLSWLASLGVLAFMACGMALMQAGFITAALWLYRRYRIPLLFILPVAWTLFEWTRNYWPFGGYPWSNLGYSQAPWLTLIQGADLVGVYGITFLIVFFNMALTEFLRSLKAKSKLNWRGLGVSVLLVLLFLGYGKFRLNQWESASHPHDTLKAALLQPNIGQQEKWDPHLNEFILELLTRMTHQAASQGAEWVVWPETALPTALPLDLKEYQPLNSFSVPVLLGILSMEPVAGRKQPILYNSALQVNAGGIFSGRIHKQHLVPLGEYDPFAGLLWFVEPVVHKMGEFRTVEHNPLLEVKGHPYGVTICYEDLFPEISRNFTRQGAHFLVNITNDAWYGDSSQLNQHLNFSRFRAVENRRTLVRGTNTGYTAVIAPTGKIQAEIPKFTRSILLAEVPMHKQLSLYTRWGDLLWIVLLTVAFVFILMLGRNNKLKKS